MSMCRYERCFRGLDWLVDHSATIFQKKAGHHEVFYKEGVGILEEIRARSWSKTIKCPIFPRHEILHMSDAKSCQ